MVGGGFKIREGVLTELFLEFGNEFQIDKRVQHPPDFVFVAFVAEFTKQPVSFERVDGLLGPVADFGFVGLAAVQKVAQLFVKVGSAYPQPVFAGKLLVFN